MFSSNLGYAFQKQSIWVKSLLFGGFASALLWKVAEVCVIKLDDDDNNNNDLRCSRSSFSNYGFYKERNICSKVCNSKLVKLYVFTLIRKMC